MKTVKRQFNEMLERGTIPVMEFEIIGGEYLVIDINVCDTGVTFEFDTDDKPVFFSGNVVNDGGNVFIYQYDEYFDNLQHYLEEIHQEINEGFIIPNGLMPANDK